jgi:16S rRNA processing protein RimM
MTYIPIGKISKPHGVRGAVKIKTDSDFKDERYQQGQILFIYYDNAYQKVTVQNRFEKAPFDIVTFDEITRIEEIEKYKGCTLYIKDDDRHQLGEDTFYFSDLIGCKVYTDQFVGIVEEVRDYPQGAMLVVKREGKKNALVPFLKQFIKSVEDNTITVVDMDGLL